MQKYLSIILVALFFFCGQSFAQFGMLKKVKDKVEEKAKQKTDEAIDKGIDKAADEATKAKDENQENPEVKTEEVENITATANSDTKKSKK